MKSRIPNLNLEIGLLVIASAAIPSSVLAGARIDLRPTPAIPPGGYAPNTTIQVDVFVVDTGNPQGAISFRELFLDFSDSPPWGDNEGTLTYPDPDGGGFKSENGFVLISNCDFCVPQMLPYVWWVYPLSVPIPAFQITMPDNGEVQIGFFKANVGTSGGAIDALNADNPEPNFGTRISFGFGGAGDPVTTWRAFTGEITGGVLELPVVPEPASCLLLVLGASAFFIQRRADR